MLFIGGWPFINSCFFSNIFHEPLNDDLFQSDTEVVVLVQCLFQHLNCFQQYLVTFISLASDYFHSRIDDWVNFRNSYSFATTETRPRASCDDRYWKMWMIWLYRPVTVGSFGNMKPEQSWVSHFTALIMLPEHRQHWLVTLVTNYLTFTTN